MVSSCSCPFWMSLWKVFSHICLCVFCILLMISLFLLSPVQHVSFIIRDSRSIFVISYAHSYLHFSCDAKHNMCYGFKYSHPTGDIFWLANERAVLWLFWPSSELWCILELLKRGVYGSCLLGFVLGLCPA